MAVLLPGNQQVKETIVLADDCMSFTIADTSGLYNSSTNLTGWEIPNMAIASVNTAVVDVTKYLSTTTYTINVYPTFPTATTTTLVTIHNTDLGLLSTDVIPDGIYEIKYTLVANLAITSATTGVNQFTITYQYPGAFPVGMQFQILNTTNIGTYTVLSTSYLAGVTTITTVEPVPFTLGSVGTLAWTDYASQYQIFFCNGTACLNSKLDQIEITECEECNDAKTMFASKINTFLQAAEYAAACGKPNKAQVLLNYINELCGLTNCQNC